MADIVYQSDPVLLINQAAQKAGSIHDDARARELGFRRGFVPGTTISLLVEDAIIAHFGEDWFHGGWHDMKFIAAAYDDEPVTVRFSDDGGEGLALEVLTPEGRLTCGGRVGLGTKAPWREEEDGLRAGNAFPNSKLGQQLEPMEYTPTKEHALRSRSPGVSARWFLEDSPFGGVLVASCGLLPVTRHGQSQLSNDGAKQPGMNGRMQMVFERPILVDTTYHVDLKLVDKGESGRTWFRTIEYQLYRDDERYGFGRHTIKWWAP